MGASRRGNRHEQHLASRTTRDRAGTAAEATAVAATERTTTASRKRPRTLDCCSWLGPCPISTS